METQRQRRALLSVSDKTGIVELAQALHRAGIQLISTGGTEQVLKGAGLPVENISAITGFPECLDGRVKTLHPAVHGGLLAMRDHPDHMRQLLEQGIEPIDIVVINLYPFEETVLSAGDDFERCIENIDIGGPSMLRSAAKNHKDVVVLTDPQDYAVCAQMLDQGQFPDAHMRRALALKVFEKTAGYDALIASYLRRSAQTAEASYPERLTLTFEKVQDLRYGENPHQTAAFYKEAFAPKSALPGAELLWGKALSYNNIADLNSAVALIRELGARPAAVAVKHVAPCGVGTGNSLLAAYERAYACDPVSIFGGIVALNQTVDVRTAQRMHALFLEAVIAPDFEPEALKLLMKKKNLRLLKLPGINAPLSSERKRAVLELKKVEGGLLIQSPDAAQYDGEPQVVTERIPTKKECEALTFAWTVCKHAKSNGIVIARENQTLGIGQGQVSRVWATENAVRQSQFPVKGAVLASDAFFPFPDAIQAAAEAGITAIIQPGGSIRDADIIETANAHGIAMLFTGMRHFKH